MLFIATETELEEILWNENEPGFYIEKIKGEFLPVRGVFNNPHVYFVGDIPGCSCNFYIPKKSETSVASVLVSTFRKSMNALKKPFDKLGLDVTKVQSRSEHPENETIQLSPGTQKLLSIIESEVSSGKTVEQYCVWADDYESAPEFRDEYDLGKVNLINVFTAEERVFVRYY